MSNLIASLVIGSQIIVAALFYAQSGFPDAYHRPWEGQIFWTSLDQRGTGRMFSSSDIAFRCNVTFESIHPRTGIRYPLRLDRFSRGDTALLWKCRYSAIMSFSQYLCKEYNDAVEVSVSVREWIPKLNQTYEIEEFRNKVSLPNVNMSVNDKSGFIRWDGVLFRQNFCHSSRPKSKNPSI